MAYLYFSTIHTLNIPFLDDFWDILRFVNDFISGSISYYSTFGHINLLSKVLGVFSFYVLGAVNFKLIGVIGNLFYVVSVYLLIRNTTFYNKPLLLISILFLFFNGRFYGISVTGHVAIQHFAALLFSILAFKNCLKNKYIKALIFSTLALLTFGSGIATLFISCLYFFVEISKKRMDKKTLSFALLFLSILIFIVVSLYLILFNFNISTFFQLLGSVISKPLIASLLGLIILLLFFYSVYSEIKINKPFSIFLLIAMYAFLNLIVIFIIRSPEESFGPFNSRYSFYSNLLLIMLLIQHIDTVARKKVVPYVMIFLTTIYSVDRYRKGSILANKLNVEKQKNIQNYIENKCCICSEIFMQEQCIHIINNSIELKVIDLERIKEDNNLD